MSISNGFVAAERCRLAASGGMVVSSRLRLLLLRVGLLLLLRGSTSMGIVSRWRIVSTLSFWHIFRNKLPSRGSLWNWFCSICVLMIRWVALISSPTIKLKLRLLNMGGDNATSRVRYKYTHHSPRDRISARRSACVTRRNN